MLRHQDAGFGRLQWLFGSVPVETQLTHHLPAEDPGDGPRDLPTTVTAVFDWLSYPLI